MKVLIGVVTYNPDISNYKNYIDSLHEQDADMILFVDNDSKNCYELEKILKTEKDCILIKNKKNNGIAKGLNEICDYAKANNYKWALILDQDSILDNDILLSLKKYCDYASQYNIGIICPRIFNEVTGDFDIVNKASIPFDEDSNFIDKCINSGSLINIDTWTEVGGFDEYLFMDGVDFDYDYRMISKGYKILQIKNCILRHKLGEKINNIKGHYASHNANRFYYISRNRIYCDYKYFGHLTFRGLLSTINTIRKAAIYERQDRSEKLRMIRIGIINGFRDGRALSK